MSETKHKKSGERLDVIKLLLPVRVFMWITWNIWILFMKVWVSSYVKVHVNIIILNLKEMFTVCLGLTLYNYRLLKPHEVSSINVCVPM
jgi:hypothetical protein